MSNSAKRVFAIASPLVVLLVSVGILLQSGSVSSEEIAIAGSLVGVLLALGIWSVTRMLRKRAASIRFARELREHNQESLFLLVEIDARSIRKIRRSSFGLGSVLRPEFLVASFQDGRVDLYRPPQKEVLTSLAPDPEIARFSASVMNRGTPIDEPCLRIEFTDGEQVDLVLYDAATGRWPRPDDLEKITSQA